jgi:hypothetical protein
LSCMSRFAAMSATRANATRSVGAQAVIGRDKATVGLEQAVHEAAQVVQLQQDECPRTQAAPVAVTRSERAVKTALPTQGTPRRQLRVELPTRRPASGPVQGQRGECFRGPSRLAARGRRRFAWLTWVAPWVRPKSPPCFWR